MSIEERVKTVIAEHLNVSAADIKAESHLVNDLGADSMDVTEIIMAVEDEFEAEITDEAASTLHTVGAITDWITANAGVEA